MLYEKYRPRTWDEIVGQDEPVKRIQRYIEVVKKNRNDREDRHIRNELDFNSNEHHQFGIQPIWISGLSGTGKTTIARLIVADLTGMVTRTYDMLRQFFPEIPCAERLSIGDVVDHLRKDGCIINEAHGLTLKVRRWLLGELEGQNQCPLICTSTKEGMEEFENKPDAKPLLSRFVHVRLWERGLVKAFAKRAREIAIKEGLDGGRSELAYEKLVKERGKNMRAVLNEIEQGRML